jgi:hypothetical protein
VRNVGFEILMAVAMKVWSSGFNTLPFRGRKNILSPFSGLKSKQRKKLARASSNLNLLFDPADGGDMCLRNIRVSLFYMALKCRRAYCSRWEVVAAVIKCKHIAIHLLPLQRYPGLTKL